MRVRISYTVDVDHDERTAIAEHLGSPGRMATRSEVQHWFEHHGTSSDIFPYIRNDGDEPNPEGRDPWDGSEEWEVR